MVSRTGPVDPASTLVVPPTTTQEDEMALFMDVHDRVEGFTADAVAELTATAHRDGLAARTPAAG